MNERQSFGRPVAAVVMHQQFPCRGRRVLKPSKSTAYGGRQLRDSATGQAEGAASNRMSHPMGKWANVTPNHANDILAENSAPSTVPTPAIIADAPTPHRPFIWT